MIVTFASWEERFVLGLQRDLAGVPRGGRALILYYQEYAARTEAARAMAACLCADGGVELRAVGVSQADAKATWLAISASVAETVDRGAEVNINISTMPRSIIWSGLWLLQSRAARVNYVYDRPGTYAPDWLSRDPSLPRLMYKMSGIAGLGRKTALLLLSGYDSERVEFFFRVYEPSAAVVGVQASCHADPQNDAHVRELKERLSQHDVSFFEIDAYDTQCGQTELDRAAAQLGEEYNVVGSSLGPKLTAISLYRLQRKRENIALAYAHSKEYNPDYSRGIGERLTGTI